MKNKKSAKAKHKNAKLHKFVNEPPTNFDEPANRRAMERALEKIRSQLGGDYPAVIAGKEIWRDEKIISVNPCNYRQVVGTFAKSTIDDAHAAIEAASEAFEYWKYTPAKWRAKLLLKAADKIRRRKHEFSAAMVFEVGKNWAEADMDTAEAIDFLEYYARSAMQLAEEQAVTPAPKWLGKEKNKMVYIPLGVGVVLPPWNFPLAILCGMTSAALVTGNSVVLKPSPDAPLIAQMFYEVMDEAGLPKGVLNLLHGGAEVGEALVAHPKTRFIAFTGSKAVGLRINEVAAKMQEGQKWIKRVIAEMGGKDAIIIDRDADLEAAVEGVVVSAFGFSGQKCSACSRAIIDAKVYDKFLDRLVKKVETLKVGDAESNASVTAVSSERAFEKIRAYIDIGRKEGRLIAGGTCDKSKGYFIAPTVFADVMPHARIAQEEIFGPVLACIKAKDFDEALQIANDTEYGLTGSVYSQNAKKLERAEREFFVGNLYLNRKCTGALVGVHPFGGFNLSGTCSKTGSEDYLLLFVQGKSVAERIA